MGSNDVVVVTGAAGFIGSCLVGWLNGLGMDNVIPVDDFSVAKKETNLAGKRFLEPIDREAFPKWFAENAAGVQAVFHLGARTDTTEMDYEVHRKWNLEYSKSVWNVCALHGIPLVYASSAATYGNGELGYEDRHDIVSSLHPLNPYGVSKNEFDIWALAQPSTPPFWAGVKFFNVFGPNEYHKGRMASVIFHAYRQIMEQGYIRLFRSHNPNYGDGEQQRDFIYVKDVLDMCVWLMRHQPQSGLYNVGTGTARTFNDLAKAIFAALGLEPKIEYIDTPADIRDKYQYYTCADMHKIQAAGYGSAPFPLEAAVKEYVSEYLSTSSYF